MNKVSFKALMSLLFFGVFMLDAMRPSFEKNTIAQLTLRIRQLNQISGQDIVNDVVKIHKCIDTIITELHEYANTIEPSDEAGTVKFYERYASDFALLVKALAVRNEYGKQYRKNMLQDIGTIMPFYTIKPTLIHFKLKKIEEPFGRSVLFRSYMHVEQRSIECKL